MKGGDDVTKARLIYLLVIASIFALAFAGLFRPHGMNDGGGLFFR
jgi:hypothetical protein